MLFCSTGVQSMGSFALVKIRATVETGPMLLPEDSIDKALEELRRNLKNLGLAVLSIDRMDAAMAQSPDAFTDNDPWSFRGRSVE